MSDTGRQSLTDKMGAALKVRIPWLRAVGSCVLILPHHCGGGGTARLREVDY